MRASLPAYSLHTYRYPFPAYNLIYLPPLFFFTYSVYFTPRSIHQSSATCAPKPAPTAAAKTSKAPHPLDLPTSTALSSARRSSPTVRTTALESLCERSAQSPVESAECRTSARARAEARRRRDAGEGGDGRADRGWKLGVCMIIVCLYNSRVSVRESYIDMIVVSLYANPACLRMP